VADQVLFIRLNVTPNISLLSVSSNLFFESQVLNQEMTDIFALKVVRLDSVDEITAEGYINEVRLLKQFQGLPRVVRLLE
jgi:hypothetical protein